MNVGTCQWASLSTELKLSHSSMRQTDQLAAPLQQLPSHIGSFYHFVLEVLVFFQVLLTFGLNIRTHCSSKVGEGTSGSSGVKDICNSDNDMSQHI
jgi:hypothetical protein